MSTIPACSVTDELRIVEHAATMETALIQAVQREQHQPWLAKNQAAIVAYNDRVEADGVFSDSLRRYAR